MIDIYIENAFSFMNTLQDNSIDLLIVDPPYNRKIAVWDIIPDYDTYIQLFYEKAYRILKQTGSMFIYGQAPSNSSIAYFGNKRFMYVDEIVWFYRNGGGNAKRSLKNVHQTLYWFAKTDQYKEFTNTIRKPYEGIRTKYTGNIDKNPAKAWIPNPNGARLINVWEESIVRQTEKVDTVIKGIQKPSILSERMIQLTTNMYDLIYIPFAGSGSEIKSAHKLQRNVIATDIDATYIDNIKEWIKQYDT